MTILFRHVVFANFIIESNGGTEHIILMLFQGGQLYIYIYNYSPCNVFTRRTGDVLTTIVMC